MVRNGASSGEPIRNLGLFLEKGYLICHGNIDRLEGIRGGVIYVNGDVNVLEGEGGIVYVNGNINHLGRVERTAVVVTGNIGEYIQPIHDPSGGYYTERMLSPFIFSSKQVEGQRVGKKLYGMGASSCCVEGYINEAHPFEGIYVVDQNRLTDWQPTDVYEKTITLCRERLNSDLDKIRAMADSNPTIRQLVEIYNKFIFGFVMGENKGFFNALSSGPSDD